MKKIDWDHIINRLDFWKAQDDKFQKLFDDYCRGIAPDSHSPIINCAYVYAFLDVFCGKNKELKDILSYYLYEAPSLDGHANVTHDNIEYDFKNREEVIKYFTKYYPEL